MEATQSRHISRLGVWTRVVLTLAFLASALPMVPPKPADAAGPNPAPVQLYYVTLPEADALTVLSTVNAAAVTPVYTYFSIAIGVNGTYVYYDQWENGYDSDIANPSNIYSSSNPGGTQIWGNGVAADGCAPNINGVPFTCTNAADVLSAGNVIIPYNAIPIPRVVAPQNYVLDNFETAALNNNDGTTNWSSDWVETGDSPNGSATTGQIRIDQNSSGQLRFTQSAAGASIDRGVNLSTGGSCAQLSFTLDQNGIDATGDNFAVQVSSDGTTYTTVDTYTSSAAAGAKTYSIAGYASANTRVRFRSVDALESNEYWSIDNARVDWNCQLPILFDGKDKVGASSSIAMARATWATGSGTLNAFAHEMYATAEWGTAYESPVGTNSADPGTDMFQYSGLSIMAGQNNTTVQIDADANGTYETTATLQEGGTTLVPNILQGARIQSDKPVQVILVTGDIGSNYESRDMNLLPVSAYGSSYWSPVGVSTGNGSNTPGPTMLWLYNPSGNSPMTFTCTTRAGSTTSGSIAARGVYQFSLSDNQAAHCTAAQPFFAVGTVDSDNGGSGQAWDWSFTLFPDSFLSTDALVGLGLGRDPNSGTNTTQDGSPLWLTPVCDTFVYVDWDNNGAPDLVDLNGDGDTVDTVDGIAESTSNNGLSISALKSVRLFKPSPRNDPYDQSGARVWSRTASGVGSGGTPGCNLALAWGEDPRIASVAEPGLDVGTSIPPLRLVESTKSLAIVTDTAPTGVLNPGDTVYYNITIHNAGTIVVNNVRVYDTVPSNTSYVANTTQWSTNNINWTNIGQPDAGVLPLSAAGGVLLGNLGVGSTFYVRFQVTLQTGNYEDITNCDTAYTDAGTFTRCVTAPVATRDWGDLPDSYGTTAAANGPRHSSSALKLGSLWDTEVQGQDSVAANGDDTHGLADEDGVILAGTRLDWYNGNGSFKVTVAGGPGCLNAWMDFTNDGATGAGGAYADGNFTKTGGYDTYGGRSEQIISNLPVNNGQTTIPVLVPTGLNGGQGNNLYYFRFRISPPNSLNPTTCTTPIAPTGFVTGGEVEDYQFDLTSTPTAVKLISFTATAAANGVKLSWTTASETDNLGFNLYRAKTASGTRTKINGALIPTKVYPGSPAGATYTYKDTTAKAGVTYYYWLQDVEIDGTMTLHGPVQGKVK